MDWAKDQLGKLVHATGKHLFAYGFTCPTCDERVRLRAGQERRPHFAHYNHSIKRDCENYRPSTYDVVHRTADARNDEYAVFERLSLRGGVFLGRIEGGRFSLTLKLPRLRPDAELSGELTIRSSLGVRSYTASQLKQPQFFPVAPQVPLVEGSASDELRTAIAAIQEDISLFRVSGNIFRVSDDCGRLIAPGEPLEWGESYRVVTQVPLQTSPIDLKCQLTARVGARGWHIYDIEVPHFTEEGQGPVTRAVARLFDRAIKLPIARVFIVDPPPHHVEPDGTYVYPLPPARLLLRRTGASLVTIDGSAQSDATVVQDDGIEWIEIFGIGTGEFSVRQDGHIQVMARIEECEFYRPDGVRVLAKDTWWEIFELGLKKTLLDNPLELRVIECPTVRVADFLHLSAESWARQGLAYTPKRAERAPSVDAKNFGAISLPEELDTDTVSDRSVDRNVAARRAWIEGLVEREVNHDFVLKLKTFWKRDNSGHFYSTPERTLVWLNPYLQLMSHRREDKK